MFKTAGTVILYFAYSAKKDLKQKRFSKASVRGQLFTKLHQHTIKTLRASRLPILHYSEENQHGNDLAERLTNAISEAFAKGFQNVIAVGNDSPDLDAKDILRASDVLAAGGSVLGPSTDGGNYLIGINQRHFFKNVFCQALKEATNSHEKLKELLGSPLELGVLTDIDDEKSLRSWLQSFTSDWEMAALRKAIRTLCSSDFTKFDSSAEQSYSVTLSRLHDRGPPQAA